MEEHDRERGERTEGAPAPPEPATAIEQSEGGVPQEGGVRQGGGVRQQSERRRARRQRGGAQSRGPSLEIPKGRARDRRLEERPGVPMEAEPSPDEGAHWEEPERQDVTIPLFKREGLERLTPVVGTAQPPRGLSGTLRRFAYGIPEHRARHWGLLLLADRVDVVEDRLGRGIGAALRAAGQRQLARRVERNPLPAVAGALVAAYAVNRALRNSR